AARRKEQRIGERGNVRKGREVLVDDRARGGQHVILWWFPTGAHGSTARSRVDVEAPRREELHVAIALEMGCDAGSRLEHERRETPLEQMGGGGQSDRSAADDGDGKQRKVGFHFTL